MVLVVVVALRLVVLETFKFVPVVQAVDAIVADAPRPVARGQGLIVVWGESVAIGRIVV